MMWRNRTSAVHRSKANGAYTGNHEILGQSRRLLSDCVVANARLPRAAHVLSRDVVDACRATSHEGSKRSRSDRMHGRRQASRY